MKFDFLEAFFSCILWHDFDCFRDPTVGLLAQVVILAKVLSEDSVRIYIFGKKNFE
jgi:hypothetical protein